MDMGSTRHRYVPHPISVASRYIVHLHRISIPSLSLSSSPSPSVGGQMRSGEEEIGDGYFWAGHRKPRSSAIVAPTSEP